MKLRVLGSGSSGNTYLLESDTECLILDAGISFMEVKKALNFDIRKIVGVIVTHCHKDHSKYISEYEKAGIQVFKPYDGMETMAMPNSQFMIQAFDLVHDVPCFGFFIRHPDIGNLVYATDTEYIKYRFKDLNHILVEANYSKNIIEQSAVNRDHVLTGHMELQTTLEFISTNDNPALKNVVLIHLSEKNADSSVFREKTQKITSADVYVAEKGLTVNLDSIPF